MTKSRLVVRDASSAATPSAPTATHTASDPRAIPAVARATGTSAIIAAVGGHAST